MDQLVLDKIYEMNTVEQEICLLLHDHFMSFPAIKSKLRYRIPFYYQYSWICYLNPQKKGGVELVFIRGKDMSNVQGVLERKGRKQVAGLLIKDNKSVNLELISELFAEALIIDESDAKNETLF